MEHVSPNVMKCYESSVWDRLLRRRMSSAHLHFLFSGDFSRCNVRQGLSFQYSELLSLLFPYLHPLRAIFYISPREMYLGLNWTHVLYSLHEFDKKLLLSCAIVANVRGFCASQNYSIKGWSLSCRRHFKVN